jgi:hypothetical protein
MKRFGDPFLSEDLSASFTRVPALRAYAVFAAVMGCVIMVWWPRGPLASYLRTGVVPDTFVAAAIGLLGCAVYMGMRFGAEDFAEEGASKVHDFVTLTPVPVSSVVASKMVAAVLHTLFLLALGLPFLIIGSSVNGTRTAVILKVLLVAGSSTLAFRAFAFLGFVLFEPRRMLKDGVILVTAAIVLAVTTSAIPALSPISAILSLDAASGYVELSVPPLAASIPFYLVSVIISAFAVVVFLVSAGLWLRSVRRKHAQTRPPQPVASAAGRVERLLKGVWNDAEDGHDGP